MACNKKLTEGILYDCVDSPKKGIDGSKAVLINWEDIDWSATTISGETITALTLKSGKTGLAVQWYKDLASGGSTFVPSDDDIEGFTHAFLTRLGTSSAKNALRANELANGARFVMVYETVYKGVDQKDAFKVAGIGNGLRLSEMSSNTNEASGSMLFTLATKDGNVEQYPYNIFLETDYATSSAAFISLFAEA